MDISVNELSTTRPSMLLTVVAWVFIVLGCFGALVCIAESIMIVLMFPHGVTPPIGTHVRDFARLAFDHVQLTFFVLLLLFLTTAAAATGLLKRSRWAWRAFIALMGVGIVWNVTSMVLTYYFLPLMSDALSSPVLQWPFNILSDILYVFSFILSIGCIGLFWWIAARLISEDVRREFH